MYVIFRDNASKLKPEELPAADGDEKMSDQVSETVSADDSTQVWSYLDFYFFKYFVLIRCFFLFFSRLLACIFSCACSLCTTRSVLTHYDVTVMVYLKQNIVTLGCFLTVETCRASPAAATTDGSLRLHLLFFLAFLSRLLFFSTRRNRLGLCRKLKKKVVKFHLIVNIVVSSFYLPFSCCCSLFFFSLDTTSNVPTNCGVRFLIEASFLNCVISPYINQ